MTGIGLNIGESASASGEPGLKVFGIILGSPAQLAGVRQVQYILRVSVCKIVGYLLSYSFTLFLECFSRIHTLESHCSLESSPSETLFLQV